ncbi:hypothetical protein B0H12DRAFT_1076528 [Mycena haematopus]|nr:hypothetical protein B0H12DRAFT_1076528 [Mycena haematopus]
MAFNGTALFADTATHIQDRSDPGRFYDRDLEGGTWQGPDSNPTWVPKAGVPLNGPLPPRACQQEAGWHRDNAARRTPYPANAGTRERDPPSRAADWHNGAADRNSWQAPTEFRGASERYDGRRYEAETPRRSRSRSCGDRRDVHDRRATSPAGSDRRPYHYGPSHTYVDRLGPAYEYSRDSRTPSSRAPSSRAPSSSRGSTPSRGRSRSCDHDFKGVARTPRRDGRYGGPYGRHDETFDLRPRQDMNDDTSRLRQKALSSRPVWTRTVFPPDISTATRGPNHHPMFPRNEGSIDDFLDDDEDKPRLPDGWQEAERARCHRALTKQAAGTVYPKGHDDQPESTGVWRGLSLSTIQEAVNALRWVKHGEAGAYQWMRHWHVFLSNDLTAPRTPGQIYMLSKQNNAGATYRYITTGSKRAEWRLQGALRAPRIRTTGKLEDPPVVQASTSTSQDDTPDVPMPDGDVDMVIDDAPVRLGQAPAPVDQTFAPLTERDDTEEHSATHTGWATAAAKYEAMSPAHWPHGMRVSETAFAPLEAGTHATPHIDNVAAWFTFNALFPRRPRTGPSIERAKFAEIAIRVFSVQGAFKRIVELGQYPTASIPFEHYPFATANIGWSQVVTWFTQHGIAPDTKDAAALESFARARRNVTMLRSDPTLEDFDGDKPRNSSDVAELTAADVTH